MAFKGNRKMQSQWIRFVGSAIDQPAQSGWVDGGGVMDPRDWASPLSVGSAGEDLITLTLGLA